MILGVGDCEVEGLPRTLGDQRSGHSQIGGAYVDFWSWLCAIADEATRIVDDWYDLDPDIAELHHSRCSPNLTAETDSTYDTQLTFDDLSW